MAKTLKLCQDLAETRGGKCLSTEYTSCKVRMQWQCQKDHVWLATLDSIINRKSWCPICDGNVKKSLDTFINQAKLAHRDKYDYSKFVYHNSKTKGIIICKKHKEFQQTPNDHLNPARPRGCPKCKSDKATKSLTSFIKEANMVHNYKYDYAKTIYIHSNMLSVIICPEHGEFQQTPHAHLLGHGCQICSKNQLKTLEQFIREANDIHHHKYNYSMFRYLNAGTKSTIICLIHGAWQQKPNCHLEGKGCPKCTHQISKPEIAWLDSLNIAEQDRHKSIRINNKPYQVDAFDATTNTIYEFYGDYWHGNPKIFNQDDLNARVKKTFGELYRKTLEREEILKRAGYNIISIWEHDFKFEQLVVIL